MNLLSSPQFLLALAKITAGLLVILALAPLLKNPVHRARLLTLTFLLLPLLFLSSFTTPLLKLIPKSPSPSQNSSTITPVPSISAFPPNESTSDQSFDPSLISIPPPSDLPEAFVSTTPQQESPKEASTPLPWIPILFAIGVLFTLLPFLISAIKVSGLPQSKALDPPLSLWKKIHQSCRKTPPLSFTPSPAAPFTCGLIRPRVLLPDDSPAWPLRRLNATLLHEAAHLQRRDPLVRVLATIVRAAFWFHPLVWLTHRQLIAAQEQACDQAALTHGLRPDDYAEDLLASATHSHLTPSEALSMAKWSQLGNRIRHILEKPQPTSMKTIALTSALALFATLAFTTIGFSDEKPALPVIQEPENNARNRGSILDRKNVPLAIDNHEGLRTYPTGKSSAHLVGYVGKNDSKEPIPSRRIFGMEMIGDPTLSQKKNLTLTIDSKLQKHCYDLLAAQEHPGSIVVQDPATGEILALVSYPSFDNNLFIPGITKENFDILNDDRRHPFVNRATSNFIPGPMAKLLAALAGEYAGLNNPEIHCKGFMSFGKEGKLKIRDWKRNRDELLRIPGALETSCNPYFMELANRAGAESLTQVGNLFHLNEKPLDALLSSKGRWNQLFDGEHYTPATLALTSIGQGNTSLTPLHVNTITSAIASGTWHQPQLILGQAKTKPSTPLIGQGKITANSLDVIREGMHLTVHGKRGTGKRATVPGIELAGKTGTAQVNSKKYPTHNSWFTGYGPYENPQYSVTVLLAGAKSGGTFAAPIAAKVFETLLGSQ
jgi:beta-lactamase regulating signal transducer with metallopeptidase domain